MPYKDKDKQKEANKQAAQRSRIKTKGMTVGMTEEELKELADKLKREAMVKAARVPERWWPIEDCALWIRTNHPNWIPGDYRTADQLPVGEFNRVSKPGDVDYIQMKAEGG